MTRPAIVSVITAVAAVLLWSGAADAGWGSRPAAGVLRWCDGPVTLDPAGVPRPVRRGGVFGTFERNPNTKRVDAWFPESIHPGHAEALRAVPNLGRVVLVGSPHAARRPTNEALVILRDVPMTGLEVAGPISDAGLASLAGHASLESLHLLLCPDVTPVGLGVVHTLPALTEFRAGLNPLTDAHLGVVARHPGITSLGLAHCPNVTDAGLMAVAAKGRLRRLLLASDAGITGTGVAAACEHLPDLEDLSFNRLTLGWQEAAVILRLPRLTSLQVSNNTGEGLRRLLQWRNPRKKPE